jgi:hypothetical protein
MLGLGLREAPVLTASMGSSMAGWRPFGGRSMMGYWCVLPGQKEATMDATEFFHTVAKRNYEVFNAHPDDLRRLWNAVVSMNTVAEYVALDRMGYSPTSRKILDQKTNEIRDGSPGLSDLKFCADTFKHVRKIVKDHSQSESTTVSTSTAIFADDVASWKIDLEPHALRSREAHSYDVVHVLHQAFATLEASPELTLTGSQ